MGRALIAMFVAALALTIPAPAISADDPNSEAIRAVDFFNPASEPTFDRLDSVIDRGGVKLSVLKSRLHSSNVLRRWAATYVVHNLAADGPDYNLLDPLLSDRNSTVRAMASVALVANGRKASIPVLIDLMRSRHLMLFWDPPIPISAVAEYRLEVFTRARFPFDSSSSDAERGAAISKWQKWWKKVKSNIRWDRRTHRYRWRAGSSASAVVVPSTWHAARPDTAGAARPAGSTRGSGGAKFPANIPPTLGAVTADASTGTLTISIQITGPQSGAIADRVRKVVNDAASFLNGPGRTGDCNPIKFAIDLRFTGHMQPFPPGVQPVVVTIEHGRSANGQERRSGMSGLTGHWFDGDLQAWYGPEAIAHELSHTLGLSDEYQNTPDNKSSIPLDNGSYMSNAGCCDANHQRAAGRVLQRQLDALADIWFPQKNGGCQKYTLRFAPWESLVFPYSYTSGNSKTYVVGRDTRASIAADFWVNPTTGEITPAGQKVCTNVGGGSLNPTPKSGMTKEQFDACRATDFPGGEGGNSSLVHTRSDPGQLKCRFASLTPLTPRFFTSVTGTKQKQTLQLQLGVPDAELAAYACEPQPEGGQKHDIHDGMQGAGALSFSVAAPGLGASTSKPFTWSGNHATARGTAVIKRTK